MAQRRSLFDAVATGASPMTPKGGSGMIDSDTSEDQMRETRESFRRRTTPVIGEPDPGQSSLQEVLEMLNGGQP